MCCIFVFFCLGNLSVGLQKIIKQCYDAYGENPEMHIIPDPEEPQEHSKHVQDYPDDEIGRIHPP